MGYTITDSVDAANTGDLRTTTYVTCWGTGCTVDRDQNTMKYRFRGTFKYYSSVEAKEAGKGLIKQVGVDFVQDAYADPYETCYAYSKTAAGSNTVNGWTNTTDDV